MSLALFDNDGSGMKVLRTRKKGVIPWVIRAAMGFMATLGYQNCKIAIKCDKERSMVRI